MPCQVDSGRGSDLSLGALSRQGQEFNHFRQSRIALVRRAEYSSQLGTK